MEWCLVKYKDNFLLFLGPTIVILVVPSVVHSVGNEMPLVEGGFFPFLPSDFSTPVGIFVSLQLYL